MKRENPPDRFFFSYHDDAMAFVAERGAIVGVVRNRLTPGIWYKERHC